MYRGVSGGGICLIFASASWRSYATCSRYRSAVKSSK
eukprot:XP_001709538.1 Hypothetical protein GL50803_35231 [Giardia lamblia ATCC 50803]